MAAPLAASCPARDGPFGNGEDGPVSLGYIAETTAE
jgi:hypothetical protein